MILSETLTRTDVIAIAAVVVLCVASILAFIIGEGGGK